MTNIQRTEHIRLLNLDNEYLVFQYLKDHSLQKEHKLKAGYKYVADTFFKQSIPTEGETDYAINYIEDELMSNKELQNSNESLVSDNHMLAAIFRKNGIEQAILSRREVEDLFTRYAYVVMGASSAKMGIEITREDFAALLILREVMHHLKFDEIHLTQQ